jgi:hypothetical protein
MLYEFGVMEYWSNGVVESPQPPFRKGGLFMSQFLVAVF